MQLYHFIKKESINEKQRLLTIKKDAELWTLEMELEKGRGKNIAERSTLFTDFYRNWVETVKKNDVREATFVNYKRTLVVVDSLFDGIQLKHLDDIIMQKRLINMLSLTQRNCKRASFEDTWFIKICLCSWFNYK